MLILLLVTYPDNYWSPSSKIFWLFFVFYFSHYFKFPKMLVMEISILHLVLLALLVWYHDGMTTGSTIQFRSIHHLHVTVTCLTKFSFCQPGWWAVTTAKFCQTRPDNSQNYHIWVGDPFVRQPSDLWLMNWLKLYGSCENECDFDKFSSRKLLKCKRKKLILVVYARI